LNEQVNLTIINQDRLLNASFNHICLGCPGN
jgi:hypothetical protein